MVFPADKPFQGNATNSAVSKSGFGQGGEAEYVERNSSPSIGAWNVLRRIPETKDVEQPRNRRSPLGVKMATLTSHTGHDRRM